MTNYFKTNQDGFGAEDANAAMLLYGMGETQATIALPRNLEDGVFPTNPGVVKAEFATIEIIKDDNITVTDNIISLASGGSGRATIRVYPNILPIKTWDLIQWSNEGGTVTCDIKKDMGQTSVATNISNPCDLQEVEIGGEYIDFEFTLNTGAELAYVTFIFTGGIDSELMTSFGRTTINQSSIGFKGNNALVWQRTYKMGLLNGGQSIKFYYNTTVSNGNNIFEVEIWEDGSKITTSGQLTHAKNTRRICEVVHVFDPLCEYTIKVISKTTSSVVLQSIQIKDYITQIDSAGVERITHFLSALTSITGDGTIYKAGAISFGYTFSQSPMVSISPVSSVYNAGISTNVNGFDFGLRNVDGSNWNDAQSFRWFARGPLLTPVLI